MNVLRRLRKGYSSQVIKGVQRIFTFHNGQEGNIRWGRIIRKKQSDDAFRGKHHADPGA